MTSIAFVFLFQRCLIYTLFDSFGYTDAPDAKRKELYLLLIDANL